MASYFIYDSINMYRSDNTVSEGQMTDSGTPTFSTSDTLTSHERANDENIGTTISGVADRDAIEYAVGSSATADAAAVYFTGDDGVSSGTILTFFIDTDRTSLPSKGTISAVSGAGWAVADLTETTGTKFFTEFNGSVTNVSEILIGKKLNFEIEPDVNVQSSINYQNEVQRSLGGVEYALNVNQGQEVITISFQNISSTFKSNLITMQDALKGEATKFLYNDGSSFHWVRLDKPMTFTEIADGRFSTQIVLRQQIQ
jgi:hypothetical protein|tara:strand:+ start:6000 stop:6770 length:771 start_codon:yes stop_codon:yes gene_type:complete